MKDWYQYRCEEVTNKSDIEAYYLIDNLCSFIPGKADNILLAKRLKSFLFKECLRKGIRWQFQADFKDWCGIYGNIKE